MPKFLLVGEDPDYGPRVGRDTFIDSPKSWSAFLKVFSAKDEASARKYARKYCKASESDLGEENSRILGLFEIKNRVRMK